MEIIKDFIIAMFWALVLMTTLTLLAIGIFTFLEWSTEEFFRLVNQFDWSMVRGYIAMSFVLSIVWLMLKGFFTMMEP